jgi:hypothetical protein
MRIVRIVVGYALACLIAAATLVLFVYTPAELVTVPAATGDIRFSEAAFFTLFVAPYLALFAGLPALFAVLVAELRGIATWGYYTVVGLAIAALGFLAKHFTESPSEATILHNYALTAFLTAGLVGGLAYWLFSGRFVSRSHAEVTRSVPPLGARPKPGV